MRCPGGHLFLNTASTAPAMNDNPVVMFDPVSGSCFVEGYGDMSADVAAELALIRKADLDRVAAKCDARQRYLARECGEAVMLKNGALVGQIDEGVFQHYVDRYGPKFWSDKSNRDWFLKRHPECRVKSVARNLAVRIGAVPEYRVIDRRAVPDARAPAAAVQPKPLAATRLWRWLTRFFRP